MSYSFSITAASKDDAAKSVDQELAQIVGWQPEHGTDRLAVQAAAAAFIAMLADPGADQAIKVDVFGSLGWRGPNEYTSASVSVTASVIAKPAALASVAVEDEQQQGAAATQTAAQAPAPDAPAPAPAADPEAVIEDGAASAASVVE